MVAVSQPNDLGERLPADLSVGPGLAAGGGDVRKLQRALYGCAKRSPERRLHALYDRVWRSDVLREAWRRVKGNRGAAGVDKQTLAEIEAYGVERLVGELQGALRDGTYRPAPVRRVTIEKTDGGRRPLGIPTVRDRVVQQATRLVLEADIRDYFGTIDQRKLLALVAERVSDRRVRKLLRQWLEAGVMEDGVFSQTVSGTPQGGVISPLLSNIYLHAFDRAMTVRGIGEVVRYADDFVVLCRSERDANAALQTAGEILGGLGLKLHPDKTRVLDLRDGREGFDFLGWHFRARVSGRLLERGIRRYYLHRWPAQRSMKRLRAKIKAKTGHNRVGIRDVRELIAELNPILRGWGNYCRTGNAADKFLAMDRYVAWRLKCLLIKRKGRNLRAKEADAWTADWLVGLGLYRSEERSATQGPCRPCEEDHR